MVRGTTPTLEFMIPLDTDDLAAADITVCQNGTSIISKTLDDCTKDTRKLSVKLTQAETLELEAGTMCEVQLRIRTTEGNAFASDIIKVKADRILKDGEI